MSDNLPHVTALRTRLPGRRCVLIPLANEHTPHIIRWRNDPNIARYFLTEHRFEPAGHEAWLAKSLTGDEEFNWVIHDVNGTPVGTVAIYNVRWLAKTAEFGRLLVGEQHARGRGLAREATQLVLKAAAHVGLSTVVLDVKSDNLAAYALYTSLNFQEVERTISKICMRFDLTEAPEGIR